MEIVRELLGWCQNFSLSRVDVLDMLFLGWLLLAFVVVGLINIYLKIFGTNGRVDSSDAGHSRLGCVTGTSGESCQWFNAIVSWMFLHYDSSSSTPSFLDTWLHSLNEQGKKHSVGLQVRFERIQPGSLPPKFTVVLTENASTDVITVRTSVEAQNITMLVSLAMAPHVTHITDCDVIIQKLHGQLKVESRYHGEQIDVKASFPEPPMIVLLVRPHIEKTGVDVTRVEELVYNSICTSCTHIVLPGKPAPLSQQERMVEAPLQVAAVAPSLTSAPLPYERSLTSLRGKNLLVKVIKASSLGEKDYGCSDAFVIVTLDAPHQTQQTSVVKATMNPFWDEAFTFELAEQSNQLQFEVCDHEKAPGDDLLGRCVLAVPELCLVPSSRQIISLAGRQGAAGSITVEFLMMDTSEASVEDSLAHRRRIETARTKTAGGTLVTTTTTTTEKPRDPRLDTSFNVQECPGRIEKANSPLTDLSYAQRVSPSVTPVMRRDVRQDAGRKVSQTSIQLAPAPVTQQKAPATSGGVGAARASLAERGRARQRDDLPQEEHGRTLTRDNTRKSSQVDNIRKDSRGDNTRKSSHVSWLSHTSNVIESGVMAAGPIGADLSPFANRASTSTYSEQRKQLDVQSSSRNSPTLSMRSSISHLSTQSYNPGRGPCEAPGRRTSSRGASQRPVQFDSPSVVLTAPGKNRPLESPSPDGVTDTQSFTGPDEQKDSKKSKGLGAAFRKRFSRPKKMRSQSADRAGVLRDENLLHVPSNARATDDEDDYLYPVHAYKT